MSASKFAVPFGLAVMCVASSALADRINEIWIKNPKAHTVVVDYAVGNSTDCHDNRVYRGSKAIPPHDTLKLTIKPPHPKFACLKVAGTNNWVRESLAKGKDYTLTVR
jgi:hypothetical protein